MTLQIVAFDCFVLSAVPVSSGLD